MLINNTVHKIFNTVAAAEAVAATNNEDADGWKYVVVPDPHGSGRAVIKIYDEDNEFIANL